MGRQLRALALSPLVGQRLTTLGPKEHYTVLERLTELIEGGQLVPAIEQIYPLTRCPTPCDTSRPDEHVASSSSPSAPPRSPEATKSEEGAVGCASTPYA